jgi:hypothetical protein
MGSSPHRRKQELFQRDDPEGNGEGAARSEFRLQPGRVNAELPTQFTADASGGRVPTPGAGVLQ